MQSHLVGPNVNSDVKILLHVYGFSNYNLHIIMFTLTESVNYIHVSVSFMYKRSEHPEAFSSALLLLKCEPYVCYVYVHIIIDG